MSPELISLIALLFAVASFWLAWGEVRRNNRAFLRLEDCGYSFSAHIREGEGHVLELVLSNRGVPIKGLKLALIMSKIEGGTASLPFTSDSVCEGEFLRGTKASFKLTESQPLGCSHNSIVPFMAFVPYDSAWISAYANNYEIARFPIGTCFDRFKGWINGKIVGLKYKRGKTVGQSPEGHNVVKYPNYPTFRCSLDFPITSFLNAVKKGKNIDVPRKTQEGTE